MNLKQNPYLILILSFNWAFMRKVQFAGFRLFRSSCKPPHFSISSLWYRFLKIHLCVLWVPLISGQEGGCDALDSLGHRPPLHWSFRALREPELASFPGN